MGVNITQYRQAIGLFNSVKEKSCYIGFSVNIRPLSVLSLVLLFIGLLLLCCGDVEVNPGPVKLSTLSVCHVNIRGLSDTKLRAIKMNLCGKFDIITLSDTFLGPNTKLDFSVPGFHPIIRRDRPIFGGGLAVYIREEIVYKRNRLLIVHFFLKICGLKLIQRSESF